MNLTALNRLSDGEDCDLWFNSSMWQIFHTHFSQIPRIKDLRPSSNKSPPTASGCRVTADHFYVIQHKLKFLTICLKTVWLHVFHHTQQISRGNKFHSVLPQQLYPFRRISCGIPTIPIPVQISTLKQCRIKTLEALVHSEKWGPLWGRGLGRGCPPPQGWRSGVLPPGKFWNLRRIFVHFGKKLTALQFSTFVNENIAIMLDSGIAVSYTHLTLPTKRIV